MTNINLRDKRDNVAKEDFMLRLDKFATLATRLDFISVTTNPLGCHACHAGHANIMDELANSFEKQELVGKRACFQWLNIVMDEGHLEPSQSWVGKTVGWPKRKIPIISLWVDFCCWAQMQKIGDEEMPEAYFFYELLDRLFIRHDDKYEFPALEKCREAFMLLGQQYECD